MPFYEAQRGLTGPAAMVLCHEHVRLFILT
jgi:hypothetical protein